MPYIYVIEDSDIIYLNYAETMKQSNVYTFVDDNLFIFDLSKDELRTILSLTYGIDRNGNVYGPSINYCGGNRNSVFFQIVESEDGAFDSSNTSTLYSFNYARNDDYYENVFDILSIDEMKMNELVLHVTGVKNYGIISKYNFYRPISEAGEIIYINNEDDKKIHTIPNIESGDDIAESLVIENKVYIIFPRHAYFYDFENFKYYYMQNDFYNAISLSNEGLTYTKISEDYLIWCSVKFKER